MSRVRLVLLGSLAMLAIGSAASAHAATLHWYATRCVDEPKHEGFSKNRNANGECIETLSKAFHLYEVESSILAENTPLLIDSSGGLQLLKGVAAGLPITIACSALDSHGKVENPTGGGAGKLLVGLLYLGCTVSPATLECKIPEGMISLSVNGVLEGTNATPVVQFGPDPSGSVLFKLRFEGCKNAGLNTEFPIEGSILGKVTNSTSTVAVEEIKGSASMLKFGGNEAGLTGEEKVEMTGGGKLEVKE